ncbi:MAG: rhomboid family intramembrane serine protease [Coprobacillaceae bacterium]
MKIQYKKSPITFGVIAICVVMYLYTCIRFGSRMTALEAVQVGGLHPILILELNEYYRLFTANIIHFDLMHIFCNCYSLYTIGSMMGLEQLLKPKRYIFLIIISMLFTTGIPCLLYVIFNIGGNSIMGGLSGVVFGLIGAMLALAICFRGQYLQIFKQIYQSVLLMLVVSVLVPSISLVGHVAGMIGGFVGMILIIKCVPLPIWKKKNKIKEDEPLIH